MGFNAGPPMTAGSYNNNVQIMQIPGYVVIYNEMVHNPRIIPIDDDTPRHGLRQWSGESRGHWDGETFVVETYNFITETSLRGSSKDTHVIERFRRVDPDTVVYEFTVEDPNNLTGSLDGVDAAPAHRRPAVRVRLPRGQHRDGGHHGRGAPQGYAARRRRPLIGDASRTGIRTTHAARCGGFPLRAASCVRGACGKLLRFQRDSHAVRGSAAVEALAHAA